MCLVIYPEVLPAPWHDTIMKVIESDIGQAANELADALHRNLFPDGRNILETLHMEKMIKKIKTNEVTVTPRPNSHVRLDELNKILAEMATGEQAIKRMAELDSSRGLVDPKVKRDAEAKFKKEAASRSQTKQLSAPDTGALSDRDLAANMLAQAKQMEIDARGLINEANRMKKEAARLQPNVSVDKTLTTDAPAPKKTSRKVKSVENATAQ